jgi:hypothetical protein
VGCAVDGRSTSRGLCNRQPTALGLLMGWPYALLTSLPSSAGVAPPLGRLSTPPITYPPVPCRPANDEGAQWRHRQWASSAEDGLPPPPFAPYPQYSHVSVYAPASPVAGTSAVSVACICLAHQPSPCSCGPPAYSLTNRDAFVWGNVQGALRCGDLRRLH